MDTSFRSNNHIVAVDRFIARLRKEIPFCSKRDALIVNVIIFKCVIVVMLVAVVALWEDGCPSVRSWFGLGMSYDIYDYKYTNSTV